MAVPSKRDRPKSGRPAGQRVSIGPEGSGARAFALNVLKRTKTEGTIGELLGFPPRSRRKLIAGDIDAAFIVTGWNSAAVRSLINAPGVELTSSTGRTPLRRTLSIPDQTVVTARDLNLANDRPPADIQLLASKSILAARRLALGSPNICCSPRPRKFILEAALPKRPNNSLFAEISWPPVER